MNSRTKKYKEYMSQDYRPILLSEMPYLVDIRALKSYADSKGVAITDLSESEKEQLVFPNPEYKMEPEAVMAVCDDDTIKVYGKTVK